MFCLPVTPLSLFCFCTMQKAIKEKEFELVTVKNQKLENLCRALQEERRSLYEKVQGAGGQPEGNASEPTEKQVSEAQPEQEVQKNSRAAEDQSGPTPAKTAAAAAEAAGTPLNKELAKLKSEQARLKEIASSFTISHVVATETDVSASRGLPEGVQQEQEEEERGVSSGEHQQDSGDQNQRDLEMESVD